MNPNPPTPRRLVRSRDDRWIAGVCGGLGRYFGLDPVIVRLAAVALTFAGGAGIIAYAGAWLLVPEEGTDSPLLKGSRNNRKLATIAGIALVAIGAIGLLDTLDFWFDSDLFWALAAIGLGGFLLLRYTDLGKRFGIDGPAAATPAGTPPAAAGPSSPGPSTPGPASFGGPSAPGSGPSSPGPSAPGPGSSGGPSAPGSGPASSGSSAPGGSLAGPSSPGPAALGRPSSTALVHSGGTGSPALPGDTAQTEPLDATTEPLDPPTEPMDGRADGSPVDDLPPNDPAFLAERREQRRRRRRTTAVSFGVLLVILGVAGTLVAADVVDIGTQTFLAGAVVLTGATVIVASMFGGAPALIWVGLLLAAGVGVVAAADIPLDKGVGDRVYRPATAAEVKPKYELGVGRLWIDLRNTSLPQGTTKIDAELGIGELDIVVPDGARVVADGEADIGDVNILGDKEGASGTEVDKVVIEPLRRNGELATRTVVIDGEVGIGEMNVYRGANAPQPGDDDPDDGDTGMIGAPFGGGLAWLGVLR